MEKRRWILFFTFLIFVIFIFVMALIVSSRGYFPTRNVSTFSTKFPSPLPNLVSTRNWQTYQNSSFKYRFQFPRDWQVIPQIEDLSTLNIVPSDHNLSAEVPIVINVSENSSQKNVDAWIDAIFSSEHPREKIQIGENTWTRVASSLSTYQAVIYFIEKDGYIYELYNSVLQGINGEVFHQLLTTFKFD